jgi:hypothetical protein
MVTQPTLRGNNFTVSRDLSPTFVPVETLKPLYQSAAGGSREHRLS